MPTVRTTAATRSAAAATTTTSDACDPAANDAVSHNVDRPYRRHSDIFFVPMFAAFLLFSCVAIVFAYLFFSYVFYSSVMLCRVSPAPPPPPYC